MNDQNTMPEGTPNGAASALSAGFGFTVGQEVTVTRKLWEPPDDCHPGGLLALPGDRLIVRVIREGGQFPISVSHHDRTDGMTFQAAPDELKPNVLADRREPQSGEASSPKGARFSVGLAVTVTTEKEDMGIQCNTIYGGSEGRETTPCNGSSKWQCSGCRRSPFGNAGPQPNILDEIVALSAERRAELGLTDIDVTANVGIQRASPASGEAPLECSVMQQEDK